jgi:hypothetical protein
MYLCLENEWTSRLGSFIYIIFQSLVSFRRIRQIPFPEESESITPASIRPFNLFILAWSSGTIAWEVSFLTSSGTSDGSRRVSMYLVGKI